jgi:hypothetical protein
MIPNENSVPSIIPIAFKRNNHEIIAMKKIEEKLYLGKENLNFGFWVYLKSIFNCARTNPIQASYNNMDKYITDRMDLCFYLKHLQQFEILKKLIINDQQNLCMEYLDKPSIFNDEELLNFGFKFHKNYYEDVAQISDYFNHRSLAAPIDKKLFDLLIAEIKSKIKINI